MKKILLILVILVIAIAGSIMGYVATIDWNQHKDKIAEQFYNLTGKKIVFEGPISFSVLPSPYLRAADVRIYNEDDVGDKPLLQINNLVANLSLIPLLQGKADVKRMILVRPQINLEIMDDGNLNWQSPMSEEQRQNLESTEITLNSVSLEDASLSFVDENQDLDLKLDKLNAEVIAESIFGPFRIEGSYTKDNNPEGFAISVGKLSDSFATSLNLVISHPVSESYLRFDGTFLLGNNALNGNVIFESTRLTPFIKNNFKDINFDKSYDYPLALSFDLKTNKIKVDFSNIVLKYGETQGAGNLSYPLAENEFNYDAGEKRERKRVEAAFNFTDLNLTPVVYALQNLFEDYKKPDAKYTLDLDFDIIGDIKAVKSVYKGQTVKNLDLSFDVINDNININKFNALLPGDADFNLKGEVYGDKDEALNYEVETSFNSNDFLKTLSWLGINPTVSTASTYRKAFGDAKLSGTMSKIQISPFSITIDKSSVSGEAGVKTGERLDALLILNADTINFDNYISQLPKEEQEKNFAQRMQYRFSKLGFLKDFEMQVIAKLDLGIYESMPFEKVEFNAVLLNGNLDIERLKIGSVANSEIEASGQVKGFGDVPACENLKYSLKTGDVSSLINKFEYKAPDIDFKTLKNFESKGIITGSLERFVTKMAAKLGNLDFTYSGQVDKKEDVFYYNGDVEAKHPDFVKMLNDFNIKYAPPAFALGLFNLNGKFSGNMQSFRANPLKFNIGYNEFQGDVNYENNNGRPAILTNMDINKFEIERFFYNESGSAVRQMVAKPLGDEVVEFMAMPGWNRNRLNYDFYKTFDLNAAFKIGELSYLGWSASSVAMDLALQNSQANIKNFQGDYHEGKAEANIELRLQDTPVISGDVNFENLSIRKSVWNGKKYGFEGGTLSAKSIFSAQAASTEDMAGSLSGSSEFEIVDSNIKGWDFTGIYEDITQREVTDGLALAVKENLQKGETKINSLRGKVIYDNGGFTFSNAVIQGSNFDVEVYGDGSLSNWDMNWLFNVRFGEPKFLPGFAFSLKGKISNPMVDVDVSGLYDLYQSRVQKIEAQKKAVEEAKMSRLQSLLDQQKKAAEEVYEAFKKDVSLEYDKHKPLSEDAEVLAAYAALGEDVALADKTISEIITIGISPNPDDEMIEGMNQRTLVEIQNLEELKKQINKIYLDDLQARILAKTDKVLLSEEVVMKTNEDFMAAKDTLAGRLQKIQTDYQPANDTNLAQMSAVIEEQNQLMKTQLDILKDTKEVRTWTDAVQLEKYEKILTDISVAIDEASEVINSTVQRYISSGEERVASEEKAYYDRLRDEEIKRKVEENTGSIAIKKTGKVLTIQRDIEEIEKGEEATIEENVKVLDFTVPEKGRVINPSRPQVKQERIESSGILSQKKEAGKSASSGVIIRK